MLNGIYETDFLGFSYGFRPGRQPHDALDALAVGIDRRKVNWVLDADIRDFFDRLDHDWLMKFLEHRIADRRVLRLIQKWLAAGVIENGTWSQSEEGRRREHRLTAAGQRLPALRLRPVGPPVETPPRARRDDRRALRRRLHRGLRAPRRCRAGSSPIFATGSRQFSLELAPEKTRLIRVRAVRRP